MILRIASPGQDHGDKGYCDPSSRCMWVVFLTPLCFSVHAFKLFCRASSVLLPITVRASLVGFMIPFKYQKQSHLSNSYLCPVDRAHQTRGPQLWHRSEAWGRAAAAVALGILGCQFWGSDAVSPVLWPILSDPFWREVCEAGVGRSNQKGLG